MKTIYTCPAYDVIDLETEVMNLTSEMLADDSGFRFCVEVQGVRGTVYREVSPGCVAYYAAKCGSDPVAAVERAKAKGDDLYWLNNCGSSLTAHNRPSYTMFLLKPGQVVIMDGQRLTVKHKRAEFFDLVTE